MNKFFAYLSAVTALFSIETFAVKLGLDQSLSCKFHKSSKCADLNTFKKELAMGCASASGNCRYVFVKANCLDSSAAAESSDSQENDIRTACRKYAFEPALLARFDSATRQALYSNFYASEGRSGKSARSNALKALEAEKAVHAVKGSQWFRFKKANTELRDRLEAEYQRLIQRKARKLREAKLRKDSASASQLSLEVAQDLVAATKALVPDLAPAAVVKAEETAQNPYASARQKYLAKKYVAKWKSSTKGKAEARRVQEAREAEMKKLAVAAAVPAVTVDTAKRISGTWATNSEGEQYLIPKAPPLPQSEAFKLKRLSGEFKRQSQQLRQSMAMGDLPPPPPSRTEAEDDSADAGPLPPPPAEEAGVPPPPPPPPLPSFGSAPAPKGPTLGAALKDQIHAGTKLRRSSGSSGESATEKDPEGGRNALLAAIRGGKQLKHVDETQKEKRLSGAKPAPGSMQAALHHRLAAIAAANADEDEEDDEKGKKDDDDWDD